MGPAWGRENRLAGRSPPIGPAREAWGRPPSPGPSNLRATRLRQSAPVTSTGGRKPICATCSGPTRRSKLERV
jgi:hypothetical protein